MTGSKRGGDYCWSLYTGNATRAPWYLGGQELEEEPRQADPSPEDSQEVEPVRDR